MSDAWTGVTLAVGHRLGPLHAAGATGAPGVVVRRGREAVLLTAEEAAVWDLVRPGPGGDAGAGQVLDRVVRSGLRPAVLADLRARDLVVDVDHWAPDVTERSARLRARPLGSAVGGDPDTDTVLLGVIGAPLLAAPGPDVEVWTAAVAVGDLRRAAALLLLLRDPDRTAAPAPEELAAPLRELWRVVPVVLAAGLGYLDVAG